MVSLRCAGFEESGVRAKRFEYSELRAATKNFSEENKLGQGAYGAVYKVQSNLLFAEPSIYVPGRNLQDMRNILGEPKTHRTNLFDHVQTITKCISGSAVKLSSTK